MADEVDPLEERRRETTRRLSAFADQVARAAGLANAADGALVALTAEALAADLWAGWRIHSPQQWLSLRMGVSKHSTDKIVRVARRFEALPTTMGLLREGRLSLDQATVIARYVPADYEASACELAVNATVPQLIRAVGKYDFDQDRIDRDAKADEERKPRGPRREVTFGSRSSDEWSIRGVLPADEGALVEDALIAARDALHATARANAKRLAEAQGRPISGTDAELEVDQPSWADALVDVAKVAATSNSDGEQVADRVGCLIHLEHPDDDPDQGRWKATLHRGPRLPGHLRRLLTCDCDVSVVWKKDGVPVQVGRSKRLVPRRVRRLIEKRDVACRVPGCTKQHGLQVPSHQPPPSTLHWEDDGHTVTWNLLLLCGHHHRLHHQGWLGITGNADVTDGPDAVRFTFATGQLISPAPTVLSPSERDEPPADHGYSFKGATGEILDARWFTLNRAVDGVDLTWALAHRPGAPPSPRP